MDLFIFKYLQNQSISLTDNCENDRNTLFFFFFFEPLPALSLGFVIFHSHVSHGILKQHQVERGIDLIVAVQYLQQAFTEAAPGFHCHVPGLPKAVGKVAVQVHLPGLFQTLLRALREGRTHTHTHDPCQHNIIVKLKQFGQGGHS